MKEKIKKIEIPNPFDPLEKTMEKRKFFDFKYDRKREKEELKVVGLIILIMLIITAVYSRTYYIIPMPLLAICLLLLYKWHCSKLKKKK